MDGFQILRCLWKRLDKMLQSIILEFSKTASLVAKNVTKWDYFGTILGPLWDHFGTI